MQVSAALIFGLNYAHVPSAALAGCIVDARNMEAYLRTALGPGAAITVRTDDTDLLNTSRAGILAGITSLAATPGLTFAWLHFSGHGTYTRDTNGDEPDRRDECIVPSDFTTAGMITDDVLRTALRQFPAGCKVVVVLDSCHSGTACDLKYGWSLSSSSSLAAPVIENPLVTLPASVLLMSGAQDTQTAADAFGLIPGQASGAMTTMLLRVLARSPGLASDVRLLLQAVTVELTRARFTQRPRLTTSYDLRRARGLFSAGPPPRTPRPARVPLPRLSPMKLSRPVTTARELRSVLSSLAHDALE